MDKAIDFDPYGDEAAAGGPAAFASLSSRCPVHHYQGRFDFYIASNPADVRDAILADPVTWSIERGSSPKLLPAEQRTALMTDDANHNRIRFIIQRGFSTLELERLGHVVSGLCDELIDAMLAIPEKRGDFYQLFAMPLPARLMCLMLGVPEHLHMEYKEWADAYFYSILNSPDEEMSLDQLTKVSAPLFDILKQRRSLLAEKGLQPDLSLLGTVLPHDFISRFMCDKAGGEYLRDDEILSLMLGIIVGGNETTMMLMANLLVRLLEKRERWDAVRADPALIAKAIEESLRIDPPVIGLFRCPRHDVALQGTVIPKDAKVMYNIAAANRDPEVFDDPDDFRLDRPSSQLRKHVAFAGGNHSCLGAPLARMEMKMAFEKLIQRLPNLRFDGEQVRAAGFNVYGRVQMPMRWD